MVLLVLKSLLVATNFALLTYLLVLMISHYNSNYNTRSWGFIFHMLTFGWLILRGAFWIATISSMKWTAVTFYLLYWTPTPLEFGAFMVLPLYFAQVIYRDEWKKYWNVVRPIYFSTIVGMVIFQAIWSWLAGVPKEIRCAAETDDFYRKECFHTEYSSDTFRSITSISFFLLACIQGIFAWKLSFLEKRHYEQFFTVSLERMTIVNSVLVCSFASRSFYQLLAIYGLYVLPDVPIADDGDVSIAVFLCVEFWIYVPIILITATIMSQSFGNRDTGGHGRQQYILGYVGSERMYHTFNFLPDDDEIISQLDRNIEEESSFLLKQSDKYQYSKSEADVRGDNSPPSELIPIKFNASTTNGELRISSLPKGQSWLIDSDPQRNWKNIFTPPESNNVTLSAYFKQKRCRGSSIGSDNSSVDGNKFKSSISRALVSSNRHDFDAPSVDESQIRTVYDGSIREKGVNKTISEYELQVEPASPNDNDSSFIVKTSSFCRTRGNSSSPKIAPYESTGGDHIHPDVFSEKFSSKHYSSPPPENVSNSAVVSHHDSMNSTQVISSITPIAPRPRFGLSREVVLSPQDDYESTSLSPSLYMFQRSTSGNAVVSTSTPDRDEAAREAIRARRTLNTTNY